MAVITPEEADAITSIERVCSVFSLLGCLFVLATFAFSSAFRNRSINRLVFLATFGNMLTNVATLMTRSYILNVNSFGCQLQSFLIQVFMQSDAYWALAMAINVYLTFYHKYDARMLRRMEIPYFILCYGIPFIPGFTFIFVHTESAGRPYGNAVLWCWLKSEWEIFRIATFYGPVWVAIIIATSIYIRAGQDIYRKRRKMLNFSGSNNGTVTNAEPYNPINGFTSAFKTTEVVQTTEIITVPRPVADPTNQTSTTAAPVKDANVSYSVTISATQNDSRDSLDAGSETPTTTIQEHRLSRPSGPTTTVIQTSVAPHLHTMHARRRHYELNNAAYAYTKCAILFFSVLLITWIPSSGNRVYSLIHNGDVSKPLFFASAFVLPLQGFWNAIIYVVTSWSACKQLGDTISGAFGGGRGTISEITTSISRHRDTRPTGGKWGKTQESTSMEDLTSSRSQLEHVSPV
ncbi:hypothetical protein B0T24DRAFT_220091 [Lasiosphaeria ovina]|uniref:G-protein coupled receptors family 2 profile 2 domain-containing protein n=1 Tax=Lasiosphaeria ovina TaxID=92902 RepID=A0AAE0KGR4_9PEZI|nr:hypothetical protein B0T24DRAFT_220091 [Lasiosphaeria ovina]